ncbi:MAG: ATP-binding protein [Dehalococcoidia bacterium]
MKDDKKTKQQLINELQLRQKALECERNEAQQKSTGDTLRLYERIVSVSYDRLAFVDTNYIYRAANDSYVKNLNTTREKIIGRSISDVLGEDFFKNHMKYYLDKCLAGEIVNFQTWHQPYTTEKMYIDVFHYPYYEADKTVGGIVISVRDITQYQAAEAARVKHVAAKARADELQRSRQRIVNLQETLRKEIAHILHGKVQNKLIVLIHKISELENTSDQEEIAKGLKELHQRLVQVLDNDIRSVSHRLYPSIVRQGLIPAIESLADHFESVLDITLNLDENFEQQERKNRQLLPEMSRLAFFRIMEEALSNIMKHSKTNKVFIDLRFTKDNIVELSIRDNGKGFSLENTEWGYGVSTMQDYAEMMGGNFTINSKPGKGTEVKATLDIGKAEKESPEKAPLLE